jgi:hypothetical protein
MEKLRGWRGPCRGFALFSQVASLGKSSGGVEPDVHVCDRAVDLTEPVQSSCGNYDYVTRSDAPPHSASDACRAIIGIRDRATSHKCPSAGNDLIDFVSLRVYARIVGLRGEPAPHHDFRRELTWVGDVDAGPTTAGLSLLVQCRFDLGDGGIGDGKPRRFLSAEGQPKSEQKDGGHDDSYR